MITVAGQKRLLSDLVASIKADPLPPWHKGYDCYLLKLNGNIYDPETGFPKSGSVTVSEFYVSGKDGRRATKRTEGQTTSYHYSKSHVANTYEYARLV
jgi:hypothetical protein